MSNEQASESGAGGRDESLKVSRATSPSDDPARLEAARAFAIEAARSLKDDKCDDVVVLDLRGRSQVTDYFLIASGTSERQLRGAAQGVSEVGEGMDQELYRHNMREREATWIVLDFVDVVVHLFHPDQRRHYDLEMLWGDAERIEWRRPSDRDGADAPPGSGRNRAGLTEDDILPE